jgi:hypothetical protein
MRYNKQSIVDRAIQLIASISGFSMGAQADEIFDHLMSLSSFSVMKPVDVTLEVILKSPWQ